MNDTNTIWKITSEGKTMTFNSEVELSDYVSNVRPVNDSEFTVEKITTETYNIKSMFTKLKVDKQMMVDVVRHLGNRLFEYFDNGSGEFDLQNYGHLSIKNFTLDASVVISKKPAIVQFIDFLRNVTEKDLEDDFVFNECDYKGCHNFAIMVKRFGTTFNIQFRNKDRYEEHNIVVCYHDCYGRHTRCVVSKNMAFDEETRNEYIEMIDKIFDNTPTLEAKKAEKERWERVEAERKLIMSENYNRFRR